jgi:hypothetical protein
MQQTTNLGLKKPEYTDFVDIQDINGNMDEIDKQISNLSQQTKTYAELQMLVSQNKLIPGCKYILSNYQTKYRQPDTNVIKTGSVERLVLTAISTNQFEVVCSSLDYPHDIIHYRLDLNMCEDGSTSRTGFIVRRIDESLGVMIDYPLDWRKMLWARYKPNQTQYLLNGVLTNYSVWTSGAAVIDRVYKVGDTLYMAKGNSVPTSSTDPNVFAIVYPNITVGLLLNDMTLSASCVLQKSASYTEHLTFGSNCSRISVAVATHGIYSSSYWLTNNVFGSDCNAISLGSGCHSNTFGNTCSVVAFGSGNSYNLLVGSSGVINIGSGCGNNIFGYGAGGITVSSSSGANIFCGANLSIEVGTASAGNKFGISANNISVGNSCYNNIIGNYSGGHIFDNLCYNNIIGYNSNYCSFRTGCTANIIGSGCSGINLMESCYNVQFGRNCYNIKLGGGCANNTFGDNCAANDLGTNCHDNIFGKNCTSNNLSTSCFGNTFGDNCTCIFLSTVCYDNTFGNNKANLFIKYMRSKNISSISILTNQDYTTHIEKNNNGNVIYWYLNPSNQPVYAIIP